MGEGTRKVKVESLSLQVIPAVSSLERQCFSSPWTEELYAAALNQPFFRLWGVKFAAQLAGYVSVYHLGDEMEIINIAVEPCLRRQGLGRALLGHVRAQGLSSGAERIFLEVRRGNVPAIALYVSLGFTLVGVRREYYPDTGEDGLVYALDLFNAKARSPR